MRGGSQRPILLDSRVQTITSQLESLPNIHRNNILLNNFFNPPDRLENGRVWNSYNGTKSVTNASLIDILKSLEIEYDSEKLFPVRKYQFHNQHLDFLKKQKVKSIYSLLTEQGRVRNEIKKQFPLKTRPNADLFFFELSVTIRSVSHEHLAENREMLWLIGYRA